MQLNTQLWKALTEGDIAQAVEVIRKKPGYLPSKNMKRKDWMPRGDRFATRMNVLRTLELPEVCA